MADREEIAAVARVVGGFLGIFAKMKRRRAVLFRR
jgi:hypothetical protein